MTLRRGISALSILLVGCMPQTLRFYQPIGAGESIRQGCGVPADVMQFALDEHGSQLRVSVSHPEDERRFLEPGARKPGLSYQFLVAPRSRIRISEAKFVLLSPDGDKIAEYQFKSLSGYHNLPSGTGTYRLTPASEELVAKSDSATEKWADQYIVSMTLSSAPERFQIHYPDMVINGQYRIGPTVEYVTSEGLFLRRRCFF